MIQQIPYIAHLRQCMCNCYAGNYGEESGDASFIVLDIHKAVDGATRERSHAHCHGDHLKASSRVQGSRPAKTNTK